MCVCVCVCVCVIGVCVGGGVTTGVARANDVCVEQLGQGFCSENGYCGGNTRA